MRRFDRITPEGTKDYIFSEMKIKRRAEGLLRDLFESYGYNEVRTPALEFFDVFSKGNGAIPQNELYTLTDCGGNLLALRADSTKPIARLYAARLLDIELPLKLYYNQTVFRRKNMGFNGKLDEIMQMGVELLGENANTTDPDFVVLTLKSMQRLFKDDFLIEIGHAAFMKPLLESLPADLRPDVKKALSTKNYPEILKLSAKTEEYGAILKELPNLLGGVEAIDKAKSLFKGAEAQNAVKELYAIWDKLKKEGLERYVIIDPTIINEYNYYTGIMFKGFVKGQGAEAVSGGRYDSLYNDYDLDIPAVGFAINISEAIRILRS